MSVQEFNSIGVPLEDAMRKMRIMNPLELFQYRYDPGYGQAATAELNRRARVQAEAAAQKNPDPSNKPTVMEELLYSLTTGKPASPPVRMAQGGIVAFNGEEESYVQRTNREARERGVRESDPELAAIKDIKERDRRRLEKYGPPRDPMLEGLASMGAAAKDVLSYPVRATAAAASKYLPIPEIPESFFGGDRSSMTPYFDQLRKQRMEQIKAQPSGISEAAIGELGINPEAKVSPRTVSNALPSSRPAAVSRPAVAPTPAVPAAPEASAPKEDADLAKYNADIEKALKSVATMPSITPEQLAAARGEAEKRRSGITSPYMAKIAELQQEQEKIGASRDAGAMSRALTQFGLNLAGKSSRPGSAAAALSEAGLGALASFEKEQLGMMDRAVRMNQNKIELQKELMKQGLDRNTAGDLAEKEARRIEEDRAKDIRAAGKDTATILTQQQTAIQRAEYQAGLLEAKQREIEARAELRNAMAGRKVDQILLATQKLEQAQQLVAIREQDSKRKLITNEIDAITKSPIAFTQQGMQQIQRLMGELSALRAGGEGGAGAAAGDSSKGWEIKPKQ